MKIYKFIVLIMMRMAERAVMSEPFSAFNREEFREFSPSSLANLTTNVPQALVSCVPSP